MNYYVLLTRNGYGPQFASRNQEDVVECCKRLGIRHFYELTEENPYEPVRIWKLRKHKDELLPPNL